MRKDRKNWKPSRFRGIRAAITSLQEAEVLDLSMEGALVEHEGMLHLGSRCLLQLECKGELLTIQCRVVHIRVSRSEPKGALSYQIGLKFVDLQPNGYADLGDVHPLVRGRSRQGRGNPWGFRGGRGCPPCQLIALVKAREYVLKGRPVLRGEEVREGPRACGADRPVGREETDRAPAIPRTLWCCTSGTGSARVVREDGRLVG